MMAKKLRRNYTNDIFAIKRDIYTAICNCFDELQKDPSAGVDVGAILSCVMKLLKGKVNPNIVKEILENEK